jgi:hypothetical protein
VISFGRLFHPAVVVTLAGQTVQNLNNDGLRVAFNVRRSMTPTPDSCDVQIYNLAPERRTAIQSLFGELGRANLLVQCGYDGVVTRLFSGDVRKLDANMRNGADFVTQAVADDAGDAITDVLVQVSTAAATPEAMILAALAAMAREGHVVSKHPSVDIALNNGPGGKIAYFLVHVGKASDLLTEAARCLSVRWWIRDGLLYMTKRGVPVDGLAVELPSSHWLSEPSDDGSGLASVTTLLDPNIVPGRQVVLRDRIAPGSREVYRAEACDYQGDTDSGPWRVTVHMRRARL